MVTPREERNRAESFLIDISVEERGEITPVGFSPSFSPLRELPFVLSSGGLQRDVVYLG
jgi:hypothetical protein